MILQTNSMNLFSNNERIRKIIDLVFIVLDYVIVFLLIISRACAWAYDENLTIKIKEIVFWLQRVLIFYILLSFFLKSSFSLYRQQIYRFILVLGGLVVFIYFNPVNKDKFVDLYIVTFLLFVFWLLFHANPNVIWRRYSNIVLIIACVSFIFYLFGSIIPILPAFSTTKRVWGEWEPAVIKNFYYCYYESQYITIKGFHLWRNCSIFTEAPKYNFILCTALASEMFLSKRLRWWSIAILVFMITTTFCTTGFVIIVLTFLFYFYNKYKNSKRWKKLLPYFKWILLGGILCIVGFFVIKFFTTRGSLGVRADHMIACMKTFWNYKFFGAGWDNSAEVFIYAKYDQGIALGIPLIMAYGGVVLTLTLLIPFFHGFVEGVQAKQYSLLFFELIFLVHFFITIIPQTLVLMMAYVVLVDVNNFELIK